MATVDDILALAQSYVDRGEMDAARIVFDRAATNSRGMLAYARFLLTVPRLDSMSRQERAKKAEQLLLYVEKNGTRSEMGAACALLAALYRARTEIRALGYSMRADRYNGNADSRRREALLKKITKMGIPELENDPYGCYIAGQECSRFAEDPSMRKLALYFLEVAAEKGTATYCGPAAQLVADLYENSDREQCSRYRKLAAVHGYPELLVRH